jgi:hypothetical protein
MGWVAIAWQLIQCICEALALARSLNFSLGRRVFFLWGCLIASDPPQPPLIRGAFRLTVMCKGIYIVNSVNV